VKEDTLMSMTMDNLLSDEDYLLIEANMLGAPLGIYKLKPDYIRFIRRVGVFIFLIGVVVLALAIIGFFRVKSNNQFELLIPVLLPALYAILKGGVFYRIEVRRARSMRIIVCEQGLFHVAKKIRSDRVEVVRWKDVLEIKKEFIGKSYYIARRNDMPITLSGYYQNLDKLVAAIRERSGMEE
jgi:hypothetical protein